MALCILFMHNVFRRHFCGRVSNCNFRLFPPFHTARYHCYGSKSNRYAVRFHDSFHAAWSPRNWTLPISQEFSSRGRIAMINAPSATKDISDCTARCETDVNCRPMNWVVCYQSRGISRTTDGDFHDVQRWSNFFKIFSFESISNKNYYNKTGL